MKACTLCGVIKPLSSFSKHRLTKDGHAYQCRKCNEARAKIWRKTPSGIFSNIKGRNRFYKKNGSYMYKPLVISKVEFIKWHNAQPKICVYCDLEEENLKHLHGPLHRRASRLTIDCVDNDLGYVMENLVLACDRCNYVKANVFSFGEMREIAQKYLKTRWQKELMQNKPKDDKNE